MKSYFKLIAILFFFIILSFCASTPESESETIRIVFIGDSITQGQTSRGADGGYSFRYWLWKMLIDVELDFDFVGSMNSSYGGSGNPGWPDYKGHTFDRDHEGHWNWSTKSILFELSDWLEDYTADLAVIHIGHIDMWGKVSGPSLGYGGTDANTRKIVHQLQADNPKITIMLVRIIPANDKSSYISNHIDTVNTLLDVIAVEEATRKSKIHIVDLHHKFDAEAWLYDLVHPNALGEKFMADRLFHAFVEHGIVPGTRSQ
jgi:lysophospholipase L1-like esterase